MTVLLAPQQLARAANLQVAHRDAEARAQFAGLLQRHQPVARHRRQRLVAVVEQIGVGTHRCAADPSAQLVKLRQAKLVGPVDDDGVGVGNVEAALDDRRADQHVELALGKGQHDLFQLALRHLAVADAKGRLRHDAFQPLGDLRNAAHTVVDEEDLPAAVDLAQNRLADQRLVVLGDGGLDRQALLGRRLDGAEIAHAGHAHVQRARNRRRRQRQHIDVTAQLLDALLVRHAEALLLVHHQQPQILERHILGQQPVRADYHIHRAVQQALQHLVLLGGGAEAAQHLDGDRKGGQAARESLRVLLRQHGGGDQHRDLLAIHHCLERGPQRDLGLAVADIAADQAIHGPAGFHVVLDRLDGHELVARLLVGEGRLQLRLPYAVRRE